MNAPRVIVALDFASADAALAFAARLEPRACRLKVGKELFTAAGPALIEKLAQRGFDIFLDLKFHDIPNTVAGAVRAASQLGVWMVNVHASGGRPMMDAARRAADESAPTPGARPLMIAVTVLTSLDAGDLESVGVTASPLDQAVRLAALAQASGLDGVVASPQETAAIRRACGPDFVIVTPGIRGAGAREAPDDQRRTLFPAEAIAAGSSYLVIGRPITAAKHPKDAALRILHEINQNSVTP